MRVGPIPLLAARDLERTLKESGFAAEIVSSGTDFTPARQLAYPTAEAMADICFVEFDEKGLNVIREELEKLAILSPAGDGTELIGRDRICPKCEKTFSDAIVCPKHAVKLISFEEFAELKRKREPVHTRYLIGILLLAITIILILSRVYAE